MSEKTLKSMIGNRIAEVRDMMNLTQSDLAERLDVGKGTVSRWENGQRPPTTERLDEIASALGVDPVVLVTLDSDDYRLAMEEAATIVEGGLADIVEALRERAADPPEVPMEEAATSDEAEGGGQGTGEAGGPDE